MKLQEADSRKPPTFSRVDELNLKNFIQDKLLSEQL